jgi:xylan 1,4-beta-xylosidase
MKRTSAIVITILFLSNFEGMAQSDAPTFNTFCNPLDLSYRFWVEEPSRREAADPTIVWFEDRYFLFASKSGS